MHDLGRQLKMMRVAQDMSQGEVAQAAGITPAVLSRIESGKRDFRLSSIEPVLDVLGVELNVALKKERPIPEGAGDGGGEKRKETAEVG